MGAGKGYRRKHDGFASGRARKLSQVSASLASSGAALSDQGDVWDGIDAKARRMASRSDTGAMAAIYETHAADLERFVEALQPTPGQRGALYLIGNRVAGLDLFATPAMAAKLFRKLLRGYAVDALEQPQAPPAQDPAVVGMEFLEALQVCSAEPFPAPGLGQNVRLRGRGLVGAVLVVEGEAMHVEAFPSNA